MLHVYALITFALLVLISVQLRKIMTTVKDVQDAVAAETTVEAGVITLLNSLKAQLDAAGTDPAALQAIKDQLTTNTAAMAAAVAANTPAAPAPTA